MIVDLEEYCIKTISGKDIENGIVYCSYKNDTICYTRKYVKPKTTAHNREYGAKLKKISLLYKAVPNTFKECLCIYANAYNQQLRPAKNGGVNGFNIFTKALCNGKVSITDLDSIESVVSSFGSTISSWEEHGLLQKVKAIIPNVDILTGTEQPADIAEQRAILQYTLLYIVYITSLLKPFSKTTPYVSQSPP